MKFKITINGDEIDNLEIYLQSTSEVKLDDMSIDHFKGRTIQVILENLENEESNEDNEQDTQVSFILPPFIPQIPEKNDSLEAFEEKRARDYEAYQNGYTGEEKEE